MTHYNESHLIHLAGKVAGRRETAESRARRERPAVLDAEGMARDLSGIADDFDPAFFASGGLARHASTIPDAAALAAPPAATGRIGVPIATPGKIVCIGLNYSGRAAETGAAIPERPVVFMQDPAAVVGPFDDLHIPRGSHKTDWEVELGVVIGGTARYTSSPRDALRLVAGYAISHDVSERTFQLDLSPPWDLDKSFETFNPLGPWLVTADEVPDPRGLGLRLAVSRHKQQDGPTGDMIFGCRIPHLVPEPVPGPRAGDLINTGTPAGGKPGKG